MKKIIYWILIGILSLVLIWASLWQKTVKPVPDVIDEQIFPNDTLYSLSNGKLVNSKENSDMNAIRLNDGDVIFYTKDSEVPKIEISKENSQITLGKGLYLISAFDAYQDYVVKNSDFIINHLSNGVYFVDTRVDTRIFSMTSLLRVQILSEGTVSTQFEIFPSEYFAYDTTLGSKLVKSDVFRIGQLATLTIADPFSKDGFESIFWEDSSSVQILFDEYQLYYQNRQLEIQKVLEKLKPLASNWLTQLEKFRLLFVNWQKKKAILESSLIAQLQTMVLIEANECSFCAERKVVASKIPMEIQDRISSLNAINPEYGENAKNLVRKYITLWSSVNTNHTSEYYSIWGSILTTVYQSIFGNTMTKNQKVYKLLSDIYSQYFFSEKRDDDILQQNLASYITYLVQSKSMGEREFLGFTYYLKEFLVTKGNSNDSDIWLFSQLTSIATTYINSLDGNKEKTNMLSIFYYTFNFISERMKDGIEFRFFNGTPDNLTLKPEFIAGNNLSKIPNESITALDFLLWKQQDFLNDYRKIYQDELGKTQDNSINYYTKFSGTNQQLNTLLVILKDYEKYRTQMDLSEKSKWAQGLVIDTNNLSVEEITSYLKDFVGLEIDTLKIENDFKKDGFYRVTVSIFWKPFRFKISPTVSTSSSWQAMPPWHKIGEIVFTDTDGNVNRNFEQASIDLDKRKKQLDDLKSSATTQEERKKYDVYNFFKTTFFASDDTTETGDITTNSNGYTLKPEIQIFVQRELIEKDFAIVHGFFPIAIRDIHADIVNGDYEISVFKIPVTKVTDKHNYNLKFDSDYIFQTDMHAFTNIKFTAIDERDKKIFNGAEVHILPNVINTVDLGNQFNKIWPLLDIAWKHYSEGDTDIRLDLDTNSVIIWGVTYTE